MDNRFKYFITSNKMYMLIIALLIVLVFANGDLWLGIALSAMYGLLIYYGTKNSAFKQDEWKRFIEDFSLKLDGATRNTLANLPFPLAMVDFNGSILWYNRNLSDMMDEKDILGTNINSISKSINLKHAISGKKSVFRDLVINSRFYDVYVSVVDSQEYSENGDRIMLLYFYDTTTSHQILKDAEHDKYSIMLMEVDNFDDVMKATEEEQKPLFIAEMERAVNSYGQSMNAMLKKYSSSKYVLCVQNKYIANEIERKFEILDSVREISMGNKLDVTVSIGIGQGGETPLENEKFALSAKELALGRGGDQVVIKNGEELQFFGGRTKEVEKRTRVRARVIAHALMDLIKDSSKVFIMGHTNADIDCLGAAVGLFSITHYMGKECYIIQDTINPSIKPMIEKLVKDPKYEDTFIDANKAFDLLDENSLLILVDAHNKGYIQNVRIVELSKRVVIIDHHRKSKDFIGKAVLSYIEPYASSTSELVTEMLQYMVEKPPLTKVEAEALLAGIYVDTKSFYFKTGVRTFEAASFLRKFGVDTLDVKKLFSDDFETYLRRAEIIKAAVVENEVAIAVCPPGSEDPVIAAQAADELLNITGIKASFVLVKIGEEILLSARSLGDINVQLVAENLGGGGHMTMAGVAFAGVTMEEALDRLKQAIEKDRKEGDTNEGNTVKGR
ncbi:MAG TPA: DHH family phosphoesterase [Clostridiaceae bacterium]|nr:DHH family phosphoesterase [Clostridiaceae bacterium]